MQGQHALFFTHPQTVLCSFAEGLLATLSDLPCASRCVTKVARHRVFKIRTISQPISISYGHDEKEEGQVRVMEAGWNVFSVLTVLTVHVLLDVEGAESFP